MMSADAVELERKWLPVRRTRKQGLKTVSFVVGGRQYAAIEQNPDKPIRWGQLVREATKLSSSRTARPIGSWRSRWMARQSSTAAQEGGQTDAPEIDL